MIQKYIRAKPAALRNRGEYVHNFWIMSKTKERAVLIYSESSVLRFWAPIFLKWEGVSPVTFLNWADR